MKTFFQQAGTAIWCLILSGLLIVSVFWALSIGTVDLPLSAIYDAIVGQLRSDLPIEAVGQGPVHDIVWLLRLPRLVLAMVTGCGLAVCGVVMQAIVKNPLADPYILGISSGASLGATAAILLGIGLSLGENFVGIAAFTGAFGISLGVLFISNLGGRSNSVKLLLAGMALSAVCSIFEFHRVFRQRQRRDADDHLLDDGELCRGTLVKPTGHRADHFGGGMLFLDAEPYSEPDAFGG